MRDYYAILNIKRSSSLDEIKRAYRKLAVQYHPDKNIEGKEYFTRRFIEINEAYNVLRDESQRLQYDRTVKQDQYDDQPSPSNASNRSSETTKESKDEQFVYQEREQFFSRKNRNRQKTPPERPIFDLEGDKISRDAEFLRFPNNIGVLIAAYTSLTKFDKPITGGKKTLNNILYPLAGLLIATSIYYLFSPMIFWAIVWFIAFPGVGLLLADVENKFSHTHYFIGVNGFAKISVEGSRENNKIDYEVNFNELTDLYYAETEVRQNFSYSHTSYFFYCVNTSSGVINLQLKGDYDKKENQKPEEYKFISAIRHYWTIFLLDQMDKNLQQDGHLIFNMYDEDVGGWPFIKIGVGFISFLKGEEETFYRFNEIKSIYIKNGTLYIEHKNYQSKLFGLVKEGNIDKIPLLQIGNRDFFYKAMELLLGYSL